MKTLTPAPYRAKRDCQPHKVNSTVPYFPPISNTVMDGVECEGGLGFDRGNPGGKIYTIDSIKQGIKGDPFIPWDGLESVP